MVRGHRVIAAALLLAAGSARATVLSAAFVGDTSSTGYYFQGYNVRYQGFDQRQTGLFGTTVGQAPCACAATLSGTVSPGTGAVSSFDQASLVNAAMFTSSAYGRADLQTGQIGVSATGTAYLGGGGTNYVRGEGFGGFGDGLNFTVAGAAADTVTDIGITVALHGQISGDTYLQEQLALQSGQTGAQFINEIRGGNGSAPYFQYTDAGGWVSYDFTPYTPQDVVFHGVFALTGAMQHIDISEVLLADSSGGVIDYAHTSDLSLQLPTGVTYTSDSGAFLTAVPEPATWAMLLAGFGFTGLTARRRRRGVAA